MQQKYNNTQSSSKRKFIYPLYSELDLRFSACYLCLSLWQSYFTLYTVFLQQPTSLLWHGTTAKAVLHSTTCPFLLSKLQQ